MRRSAPIAGLLALCLCRTAAADTVVLSDGQELRGVVTEAPGRVTVTLDFGSVSFDEEEVVEIRRESTALHELDERYAALRPDDASGRSALARWADAKGLKKRARDLYREVLILRPDDVEAHRYLGHEKLDGAWLTREEHLRATGHVLYGGKWVTEAQAAELERQARSRRERRQNERIAELEKRLAEQRADLARMEEDDRSGDRGAYLYSTGWYPPYYRGFYGPRGHRRRPRRRAGPRAKLQPAAGRPAPPAVRGAKSAPPPAPRGRGAVLPMAPR